MTRAAAALQASPSARDIDVLVADATGTIVRIPGVLPAVAAQAHHAALRAVAGGDLREEPRDEVIHAHAAVTDIATRLIDVTPAPFSIARIAQPDTGLGCDARDAIALCTLALHQPIAHVHLGAPRRAFVRARQAPRRCVRVDLAPGDVLLMGYATYLHYDLAWPLQRAARTAGSRDASHDATSLDVMFAVCTRAPHRRDASDANRFVLAPSLPAPPRR